jgi:O-antigen/teichoic acid export membrane protein
LIAKNVAGLRLSGEALERLVTMGGSRAVTAGFGFLATLLIARALPPETLGLWSMALAIQGIALHLGEAGLRSVAIAETARQPRFARAYLRRAVTLRLLISTGVIAAASLAASLWSRYWGWAGDPWLTALLLTSLWPIALQLDWLPLALGRNRLAACLLLVRTAAFLLLLAVLPLEADPIRLAWLFIAAWWLAAAVSWPCLRLASAAADPTDGLSWPVLLRNALPIAAGTIASQLLLGLDILLVGARFGPADAAFYFLASAVLVAGLVLANGLGQTALARMGARASDRTAFRQALAADLRLVAGIALVVALTMASVAPFLLPLAFGAAYQPAVAILPWLLPWFVLTHATTILQAALSAAREGRRLLVANLWMAFAFALGLAVAWQLETLWAFALARGLAELLRFAALWHALPGDLRPVRSGRRA